MPKPRLVFAWFPMHIWNGKVWGTVWLEKVVRYKMDAQSSFWHHALPEEYEKFL